MEILSLCLLKHGEVSEWSKELDSKSSVRFSRTVGSNPTLSANFERKVLVCIEKYIAHFARYTPEATRISLLLGDLRAY